MRCTERTCLSLGWAASARLCNAEDRKLRGDPLELFERSAAIEVDETVPNRCWNSKIVRTRIARRPARLHRSGSSTAGRMSSHCRCWLPTGVGACA
jgi:hypothetical protein